MLPGDAARGRGAAVVAASLVVGLVNLFLIGGVHSSGPDNPGIFGEPPVSTGETAVGESCCRRRILEIRCRETFPRPEKLGKIGNIIF